MHVCISQVCSNLLKETRNASIPKCKNDQNFTGNNRSPYFPIVTLLNLHKFKPLKVRDVFAHNNMNLDRDDGV